MFGLDRKQTDDDELPVFVRTVNSDEAFNMAKQLWEENVRLRYLDNTNHKEFIRFTYTKPACHAWLQHDQGRTGIFELVLRWKDNDTTEVFVLYPQQGGDKGGDDNRLNTILHAMLVTPSIVPAARNK